ncbi:hypothetical protein ADUPG1_012497 [Aduncisulcus paluster]|uniref:Rab-GAP TBC domain-containing protein n=1 Tax=Aduncisulcus paluster TaxID=2918883 RepID=A0ABQ5K3V4_9EUKA|nr:hypothetical protein ADUPG1_012497 [Aduncisulcus paluster]
MESPEIISSFMKVLEVPPSISDEEKKERLIQLKTLVLHHGIPDYTIKDSETPLRQIVWKCLLRTGNGDIQKYLSLVKRGKSSLHDKIKRDTDRTFKSNRVFEEKVPEDKLIRLLNAYVHYKEENDLPGASYVQGMNVVAAPLLFVLPEHDAFFAFVRIVTKHCPTYFMKNLEGVHAGAALVDIILETVDPELFEYLSKHKLIGEIWAFSRLMTFCASQPPLDEALKLWDFFFAFGEHLTVPAVVAQAIIVKKELLESAVPVQILSEQKTVEARQTIRITREIFRKLDQRQQSALALHMIDSDTMEKLLPSSLKKP